MSFGTRLYDMMRLRCMTVLELSKATGVSRNSIYLMLKDAHEKQKLQVIKAICKELGCTPGWLLR